MSNIVIAHIFWAYDTCVLKGNQTDPWKAHFFALLINQADFICLPECNAEGLYCLLQQYTDLICICRRLSQYNQNQWNHYETPNIENTSQTLKQISKYHID